MTVAVEHKLQLIDMENQLHKALRQGDVSQSSRLMEKLLNRETFAKCSISI